MPTELPKGQYDLGRMPRFGLPPFASRLPQDLSTTMLDVTGNVQKKSSFDPTDSDLPYRTQTSDFHCVATWSCRQITWGGWRFADFWARIIANTAHPDKNVSHAIFLGRDGYAACLPLEDLFADDVLIADEMNGTPLSPENGAALRLIAPAHYGYKSVKHLRAVKLVTSASAFRGPRLGFLIHPRGRVALEERGSGVPAWLLRNLYRPTVGLNIRLFERGVRKSSLPENRTA